MTTLFLSQTNQTNTVKPVNPVKTMMPFNFAKKEKFQTDFNNPIYNLEKQVDDMGNLPPTKQLSLLYNDAQNYKMSNLSPTSEWYDKRHRIIQDYAALDWLALGEHLNRTSTMLGNLCTTIYRQLQELTQTPSFNIALFCSALSKIDHLWHTTLPSQLEGIHNPAVIALLKHCGQHPMV